MADNQDDTGESPVIGIANSRSKREKGAKVTNRLAALATLRATRDSGKKHLADVEDFKVRFSFLISRSRKYDSALES